MDSGGESMGRPCGCSAAQLAEPDVEPLERRLAEPWRNQESDIMPEVGAA